MTRLHMAVETDDGRSYLDALYADLPDTRPLMRWPVFDDPFFAKKPVQWFDDYGSAVDFVTESLGTVNLYIGEPRKWRRVEA